jgi:hypothetical protein
MKKPYVIYWQDLDGDHRKTYWEHQNRKKFWAYLEAKRRPIREFLQAIARVCEDFGLSLSHEDGHGAFEITPYDDYNQDWLSRAHFSYNGSTVYFE